MGRKKKEKKKPLSEVNGFDLPGEREEETEEDKERLRMIISSGKLEMETGDISIVLSKEIYRKLLCYTLATDDEISGLGLCEWNESEVRVTDLFLLKQENGAATTELDDEEVSKLITEMVKKKMDTAKLRFWFHSKDNIKVA